MGEILWISSKVPLLFNIFVVMFSPTTFDVIPCLYSQIVGVDDSGIGSLVIGIEYFEYIFANELIISI